MSETIDQSVINNLTDQQTQSGDPAATGTLPDNLKTIKVDGKEVEVKDFDHLRALAQKGASFEPKYNEAMQRLKTLEKDAKVAEVFRKWRQSGDLAAYREGLEAVGYTAEEIRQMTSEYETPPQGGKTDETQPQGAPTELLQKIEQQNKELAELRSLISDRESHTVTNLIREQLKGNDYIKKILSSRSEENGQEVLEYLLKEATAAANAYVKEHPYMPSSDRDIAGHAADAVIKQARMLGLDAPTHSGRGGGFGGPGEVEIKPPTMPKGAGATPDSMRQFISQHLSNALKDRQNRFGVGS